MLRENGWDVIRIWEHELRVDGGTILKKIAGTKAHA
jgi:very-short-patch-repair endonuclease